MTCWQKVRKRFAKGLQALRTFREPFANLLRTFCEPFDPNRFAKGLQKVRNMFTELADLLQTFCKPFRAPFANIPFQLFANLLQTLGVIQKKASVAPCGQVKHRAAYGNYNDCNSGKA